MSSTSKQFKTDEKRRKRRVYYASHPEQKCKAVERTKRWKKKNKEKHKAYGISTEQYDAILKAQKFQCAICKTDKVPKRCGWSVDHDHIDGRVRGLLCPHCNWMLGHAKDDTGILTSAISYLQRPPADAVLH